MPRRSAFSLVELLVVIAVLAILVSLLFAGIQSVRRSARNVDCQSNIRQIAVAITNFESSSGHLPNSSWHLSLFPYLELNSEWDEILANRLPAQPSIFRCPADGLSHNIEKVFSNYLGCSGVWLTSPDYDGVIIRPATPTSKQTVKFSEVTNGLPFTALVSEGLIASNQERHPEERLRVLWKSPGQPYLPTELDQFAQTVRSVPQQASQAGWLGSFATRGSIIVFQDNTVVARIGMGTTMYNHAVEPQQPTMTNAGNVPSAIIPPSSNHVSVNVAYCDGHVASVSRSIDITAWRSQGNRRKPE